MTTAFLPAVLVAAFSLAADFFAARGFLSSAGAASGAVESAFALLADFFTAGFAATDFFFVDASAISTPFVAGALSMPVNGFDSVILLITLARAVACLDADFAAKSKASRRSGADARRRGRRSRPTCARVIVVMV